MYWLRLAFQNWEMQPLRGVCSLLFLGRFFCFLDIAELSGVLSFL